MNRTATASSIDAQPIGRPLVAASKTRAVVLRRAASLVLVTGPAVAIACGALLTRGGPGVRAPALFTFLACIAAIRLAHRLWEASER